MEINMFSDLKFGDILYVPIEGKTISFLYCGIEDSRILGLLLRQSHNRLGSAIEVLSLKRLYRLKCDSIRNYEARLVSDSTKDNVLRSLLKEKPYGVKEIEIRVNITPRKNDFVCHEGKPYYLDSVHSSVAYLYPISDKKEQDSDFEIIGKDNSVFYISLRDVYSVPLDVIGFLWENNDDFYNSFHQHLLGYEEEEIRCPYSYNDIDALAKNYRKEILGYSLKHYYPILYKKEEKEVVKKLLFSLRAGLEIGLIYNAESS